MANRIVGLDIGSYAVKAVTIELQRELEVVDYRELVLADFAQADGSVLQAGEEAQAAPSEEAAEGGDWAEEEVDMSTEAVAPDEPVEAGEPWVVAIRRLQNEGFFEGVTRVVTSFPDGKAVTLHVEVPFERKANVESVLPHLLADQLPLPLAQVVYDFIIIPGRNPQTWEALVGVLEKKDIAEFLLQIQSTGVDPAVVGVPELMLRYAGDQAVSPDVESYGIIDLGHRFTRLVIMSGGKPVLAHTVRSGGEALTAALAQKFRLSIEDAARLKHNRGDVGEMFPSEEEVQDGAAQSISQTLKSSLYPIVRDLRRTFQSAFAKYKVAVDVVYICGGTSRLAGIGEYLHREFQVPVEHLAFDTSLVWVSGSAQERTPEATLALGGALQVPLDRAEQRLIDFRQNEFAYRGKSSYLRSQMVRLGAIAAVLVVMLVGVLLMQRADQQAQLRAMQAALAEQTTELFGEPVRSPQQVQARLAGEAGPDRDFVPRMSAYELMFRILDTMSSDVPLKLERIEIDTDRNLVQIVGITDSPQSVDVLAADIERKECVVEVRKDQVNVRGDREVQFELQVNNRCS